MTDPKDVTTTLAPLATIAPAATPEEKAMVKYNDYFSRPEIVERFKAMMGTHQAQRYIAEVLTVILQNEKLQKCTPTSLYVCAVRSATLGLSVDPTKREAYLVPYKDKATLIPGYKGLYDLCMRAGMYEWIHVSAIYEGEVMTMLRPSGEWNLGPEARTSDKVIGWWAAFKKFGRDRKDSTRTIKSVYMTCKEIHDHAKQYSPSYDYDDSFWKKERPKMERKTVLRQLITLWGEMDPPIMRILHELDDERDGETIDAEFELSGELAKRSEKLDAEEGIKPRKLTPNLDALGLGAAPSLKAANVNEAVKVQTINPDPISQAQWDGYLALCQDAEKFNVAYVLPDWQTTTAADLTNESARLRGLIAQEKTHA